MAPMPPMMRPEPSHCILSLASPQESQLPVHFAASWLSASPAARTTCRVALEPFLLGREAVAVLRDFVRSAAAVVSGQAEAKVKLDIVSLNQP